MTDDRIDRIQDDELGDEALDRAPVEKEFSCKCACACN